MILAKSSQEPRPGTAEWRAKINAKDKGNEEL
jgi:hypothetical protein